MPTFIKDLKALKSTPVYESVKSFVFKEIPSYSSLDEISNLKKLKDAYLAFPNLVKYSDYLTPIKLCFISPLRTCGYGVHTSMSSIGFNSSSSFFGWVMDTPK